MSNTVNYNLQTWSSAEVSDTFNNFLFGTAGNTNSNMTKIDTQMKLSADGVAALKSAAIRTVPATMVSDYYYIATISDYSAYVSGNIFILRLDVSSKDTLTLNINSIGTLSVMKYKSNGSLYNIASGDIIANVPVLIVYDGTRWVLINDIKAGEVSTSTDTAISGILKGSSNKVAQAVAGTDFADPSKMFYPNTIYGGILLTNFDTISVSGFYTGYGTATGAPNTSSSWYILHINSNEGTTSAIQYAYSFSTTEVYKRIKVSSSWGTWGLIPADQIGIVDSGDYFSTSTVEGALQELGGGLETANTAISNRVMKTSILSGSIAITVGAGVVASASVTFHTGWFSAAPIVVVSVITAGPNSRMASVGIPSSTSVTIYAYSANAATVTVEWIAYLSE